MYAKNVINMLTNKKFSNLKSNVLNVMLIKSYPISNFVLK